MGTDLLGSLSVGRVSGLIAFGTSTIAFTFPLLLAVLLLYHYDKKLSAASWSVLARQIHSSAWPSVLRSDSVSTGNVHWSVTWIAYVNILFGLLVFIAGVVTPLGLSESVKPAYTGSSEFVYAPDLSMFGKSTMSRPEGPMSRDCVQEVEFCPGALLENPKGIVGTFNTTPADYKATWRLPTNLTTMFSSATADSTVAGALDIQYRSWISYSTPVFDNSTAYPKGQKRHIDMLIQRDEVVLVEGIVADMVSGGIGFRNHTVPSGLHYGAQWEEDLLWLEPDIACANTNLSLQITAGNRTGLSGSITELALVDDGGFANLRHGVPVDDWVAPSTNALDVQFQADHTAWLHNILAATFHNITTSKNAQYGLNVSIGKHYAMDENEIGGPSLPLEMSTKPLIGNWLGGNASGLIVNGTLKVRGKNVTNPDQYPKELAMALFADLSKYCTGLYSGKGSLNRVRFECGQLMGVPQIAEGKSALVQEPGSKWKIPLFSCAGAVKASVKTVSFTLNGTATLENMSVLRIQDKKYKDEDDYPLWAYEDKGWVHRVDDLGSGEANIPVPLWGIVDKSYKDTPGHSFLQAPSFYLPHVYAGSWDSNDAPLDMTAAAVAPVGILSSLLTSFGGGKASYKDDYSPSYSGLTSLALSSKWNALAETDRGHDTIFKLIWTDMMANTVLGTNLNGESSISSDVAGSSNGRLKVRVFARRVSYKLRYAVPAIILLAAWASLVVVGLLAGVLDRHVLRHMRTMLNDTSVGRVALGSNTPEGRLLSRAPTRRWQKQFGATQITLKKDEGETEVRYVQEEARSKTDV